jgi:hypothetical protein
LRIQPPLHQSLRQLERHARAAQILAGIIASILIWINNDQRLRNAVHPRQMMVGDDQVYSGTPRRFGGRERADAGIHADDQPHAVGGGALDHFVAHAIAFADAMRHMKVSRARRKARWPS